MTTRAKQPASFNPDREMLIRVLVELSSAPHKDSEVSAVLHVYALIDRAAGDLMDAHREHRPALNEMRAELRTWVSEARGRA